MHSLAKKIKVMNMTADELKTLIKDVVYEVMDPDYGLELRGEAEKSLKESRRQKERGEGLPLKEVKKRLGLK
ncbi:MAG: hypothetical protein HY026_08225 [Deltaproteobacteria bacterium]|nr:hypothetical protein [Deltaproteobacteria bacterium]